MGHKYSVTVLCLALILLLVTGCREEEPTPETRSQLISHKSQMHGRFLMESGSWKDLDNWALWTNLVQDNHYEQARRWRYHTSKRLAFHLTSEGKPAANVKLELKHRDSSEWICRTDNLGRAEMFISLFSAVGEIDLSRYQLYIDDQLADVNLLFYEEGVNELVLSHRQGGLTRVELAFIIDATGSMKEEYNYLRTRFGDLIRRSEQLNSTNEIFTSVILYRDENDVFAVKKSPLSKGYQESLNMLKSHEAAGGTDYHEVSDLALREAVRNLNWSVKAKTRLAFLFLDGPPRFWAEKISDMQQSVKMAAAKGIKLIPILSADIEEDAEFLARFFTIATNGDLLFLTTPEGDSPDPTLGIYSTEELSVLLEELISSNMAY